MRLQCLLHSLFYGAGSCVHNAGGGQDDPRVLVGGIRRKLLGQGARHSLQPVSPILQGQDHNKEFLTHMIVPLSWGQLTTEESTGMFLIHGILLRGDGTNANI